MSVIYITEHDEIIYNAIKTRKRVLKKEPRYKSYLDTTVNYDTKEKAPHGTMGPPEVTLPNPSNFLRKHARKSAPVKKSDGFGRQCLIGEKRPPVPTHNDIRIKKDSEEKNFIQKNIINNIKKKPPNVEPKFVDTRYGTTQKVENSGLEPNYIRSKSYGKPPSYLVRRAENTKKFLQCVKDHEELKTLSKCRYINRQERQKLLDGLKQNWEEMQKQYQLLPIITDTIPKILKKTKMEADLKELEKDITLIEKHPYIYVYDDEE